MKVEQTASIVNLAYNMATGKESLVNMDLSNTVDAGHELFEGNNFDNWVKKLPDAIREYWTTTRKYEGLKIDIMRTGAEFAAALARVTAKAPVAVKSEMWDLKDGQTYSQDTFHGTEVVTKFWQDRDAFDYTISIPRDQAKSSFDNGAQLQAFIDEVFLALENRIVCDFDNIALMTLATLMAYAIDSEAQAGEYDTHKNGKRFVNLRADYNEIHKDETGFEALTKANCLYDDKFCEYMATEMIDRAGLLKVMGVHYNVTGMETFIPDDLFKFYLLEPVKARFDAVLKSTRFHDTFVTLPGFKTLPFWTGQGADSDVSFDSRSKINVTHKDVNVELDGIIAVMFDERACLVADERTEIDTHPNGLARFYNYFYHLFYGALVDTNFNCVVFSIA